MRSRYKEEEISKEEQLQLEDIFGKFKMSHFDSIKIIGERSPNYFVESKIPRRIREYNPNIKVVLLLCEPSDRLELENGVSRICSISYAKVFKILRFSIIF